MAKKDISKFQKALLSKTNMMKEDLEKIPTETPNQTNEANKAHFEIDEITLQKFNQLAEKHSIEVNELLQFGLTFFLEFEEELFSNK